MGTATPAVGLYKPDDNEDPWGTALRGGFDDADARLSRSGAGDPNGVVAGHWVGQPYFDTTGQGFWACTTATGLAATSVWTQVAGFGPLGGFGLREPLVTTSSTPHTHADIPASARMLVLSFSNLGTDGINIPFIRAGISGGLASTGYEAVCNSITNIGGIDSGTLLTDRIPLGTGWASTTRIHGSVTLTKLNTSDIWCIQGTVAAETGRTNHIAGRVDLTAALDRTAILTSGGNQFNSGRFGLLVL